MLSELQAQDHLSDLEAKEGGVDTNTLTSHPTVQAFWAALTSGELGKVIHQPMLSRQLYRFYLIWCRVQGIKHPLDLPRLINPLFRERCITLHKKRYVKPDGEVFGPMSFVFTKDVARDTRQPETIWLGDCVRHAESALAELQA